MMGSITCTKEDGTQVLSASKVKVGEKLTFTAKPRRGYRITNWQREKKNVATAEFENLTDFYSMSSITLSAEDAMDIQVDLIVKQIIMSLNLHRLMIKLVHF